MSHLETIFRTSFLAGNPVFLLGPPFAIIVFCIVLSVYNKKPFWKCLKGKAALISCVLIILEAWIGMTQIYAYRNVVIAYKRGQYQTITGEIQDYTPPATNLNVHESFRINDVLFSYGGGAASNYFGYDKTALNGGAILRNGLIVNICYITYDNINIIVQFDVAKEPNLSAAS